MTITLIIARHGNTFEPDEIPTRVGKHTDLKLAKKGQKQGVNIGLHLKKNNLTPDAVYASTLIRTQETARLACIEMGLDLPIQQLDMFDEIDYGPDENKPEDVVVARIGQQAIDDWNAHATVPDGWCVNPAQIIQDWQDFANDLTQTNNNNRIVLVVTSNGVARFASHITGNFDAFKKKHPLKLRTGAFGILEFDDKWTVKSWDERP